MTADNASTRPLRRILRSRWTMRIAAVVGAVTLWRAASYHIHLTHHPDVGRVLVIIRPGLFLGTVAIIVLSALVAGFVYLDQSLLALLDDQTENS